MKEKLTTKGIIGYACGMLGWSILTNIITVMLIYIYQPPNNVNLSPLVPQIAVFGFLSVLSLIVASGRFVDAITDPLIAYFSDHSMHRKGRRIPFMQIAILPCLISCVLIFVPYISGAQPANYVWLGIMQALFYISLTLYIVPYTALLPELATSTDEKVYYSAWLSAGYVMGIIISSQTPLVADLFSDGLKLTSRLQAMQLSIGTLTLLAGILLVIPTFVIDESRHCTGKPTTLGFRTSLSQTLGNQNFRRFVFAESLYIIALTVIVSGLLYFLTVLLDLPEALGGQVMGVMVIISLFLYPLILRLVKSFGKRKILLFSFAYLSVLTIVIFFLGKLPFSPKEQIFGFAVLAALPLASLGIIPYAIIAEVANLDHLHTGQQKEAMYFAMRNLAIKIGQTLGVAIFAILILFGKDPGDDFGIRLAGIVGCVLCALAFLIFYRFKDSDQIE